MAPDVIHIGDRYYMYIASNPGGQPRAAIHMIWSKSLDPNSPDFGFHDETVVATSDGVEDCDAIDPAFLLDPTPERGVTGRRWQEEHSWAPRSNS